MTETKTFPTLDVLTTITGVMLVEDIGRVYEVLNWMTGESVFTHQLPRVSREAREVVLKRHAHLAAAIEERDQINRENWRSFAARWLDAYGPTIAVPKMTTSDHERIDPISELAERVPPSKIIVIGGTDGR